MITDHALILRLLAITKDGQVISTSPPTYSALFLAALLTLCTGLLIAMYNDSRGRKERDQQQMAAVNQGLALLLEKQGETTKDVATHANEIRALQSKASAYETSLALLQQAIDLHIQSSEEDRRQLHRNIDAVRDGVRDYRDPINRRSTERD